MLTEAETGTLPAGLRHRETGTLPAHLRLQLESYLLTRDTLPAGLWNKTVVLS